MSRREQREQIFKILFGVEFHSADELEEHPGRIHVGRILGNDEAVHVNYIWKI